jgi:hypothetical protein
MEGQGRINVRFRRLRPDENKSLATCNIVVMEFCDKGSLRHAMKRGVFHKRLGNTSVAVDLCAIVQVGPLTIAMGWFVQLYLVERNWFGRIQCYQVVQMDFVTLGLLC